MAKRKLKLKSKFSKAKDLKKTKKYQTGGVENPYASNVIPEGYSANTAHISSQQADPVLTNSLVKQKEEMGEEVDLVPMQAKAAQREDKLASVTPALLTAGKGIEKASNLKNAGKVAKVGSLAGWAGPQAVGTAVSTIGKGIDKASDDNDVTTMNAGETTGKVLTGAGYGATAAGIAGSLGAFGSTMSWNPVGWAALAAAGIAGGVGLAQRNKGRRLKKEAEAKFSEEKQDVNRKLSAQEHKGLSTTGYDFGNNLGLPGAMGSEQRQYQTGGVGVVRNRGEELPGGVTVPIGDGAVEYKGRTHEEGGIMRDSDTEVENGETEDSIQTKDGKKTPYFFSNYLKVGGKTFAKHHKDLIKAGASDAQKQELATMQEKKAGRDVTQIAQTGGFDWDTSQEEPLAPINQISQTTIDPNQAGEDSIMADIIGQGDEEYTGNMVDPTITAPKTTRQKIGEYLKRAGKTVKNADIATTLASAGQMIPALKAAKDTPDYMGDPGRMAKTTLDRVNFNSARSSNAAKTRAVSKNIENIGAGPGAIAAMMANMNASREADLKITAEEGRVNSQIANAEASMNQSSSAQNIANLMKVNEFNAGADAATKDRKLDAYSTMASTMASINADRLANNAQNRVATAIQGNTGVNDRLNLKLKAAQMAGSTSGPAYEDALKSLTAEASTYMLGGFSKLKKKK